MNLRFPEHPEVASALLGVEVLEQEVWVYRVWRGDARACGLSIPDGKRKSPPRCRVKDFWWGMVDSNSR